jgi:hypothetical protein
MIFSSGSTPPMVAVTIVWLVVELALVLSVSLPLLP